MLGVRAWLAWNPQACIEALAADREHGMVSFQLLDLRLRTRNDPMGLGCGHSFFECRFRGFGLGGRPTSAPGPATLFEQAFLLRGDAKA